MTSPRSGRLSRQRRGYPDQAEHPVYDAALASELLARTCELPGTKKGLVALLTEYRHALSALTSQPGKHPDDQAQPSAAACHPAATDASTTTR